MPVELFSLRDLSAALEMVGDEVKDIVRRRASAAATATIARAQARYPIGPVHWRQGRRVGGGTLRRSVKRGSPRTFAVTSRGVPVPSAVALVTAPHVHFYEDGAGLQHPRRDPTRGNADRGVAKPHGTIFVDIAVDERTAMLREAEAILFMSRELV